MSWLARSIANSLTDADADADGEESEESGELSDKADNSSASMAPLPSPPEGQQGRGVKDDLSDIKNSLARQLRGVASFLAPPPTTNSKTDEESEKEEVGLGKIDGIRSDFAEIRVKVKAGISKLLQSRPDEVESEEECSTTSIIGVTDELLAFVKDLVTHPRTWVRFPLPDDADADDFTLNDSQRAHARAVEHQVPELADLRWELCPDHMSKARFWMIYFVLVHPKLDKYDALALSTLEIVEARAMLTQESKHRRKVKQPEGSPVLSNVQDGPPQSTESSMRDVPTGEPSDSAHAGASVELDTHTHYTPGDDNPALNEAPAVTDHNKIKAMSHISSKVSVHGEDDDEDGDDWLNDETADGDTIRHIPINNDDEDVSFSDLEEDDATGPAKGSK